MSPLEIKETSSCWNVYEKRGYVVCSASHAKQIAKGVVGTWPLDDVVYYGLPELDDRYHVWRVPLLGIDDATRVGEIVLDAKSGVVDYKKCSSVLSVQRRAALVANENGFVGIQKHKKTSIVIRQLDLRNTIFCGASEKTLADLPSESVQLMFTSPPYFNARPDYTDYHAYGDYLSNIRKIMVQVNRVLEDGRFAVVNTSPVLLRRARRSESSKRIAVPFDIHQIMIQEGFEFIDDIIWVKPEGAGWATGRGRRFAADRNPLQYKAVPVTEYVMVYRKKSEKLIDWHIRNHHDQAAVQNSKIADGYEKTNIWKIHPAHSKKHPAIFPIELAEKVIKYYSFIGDVVLDPYAGIGTVGAAASRLNRRFVLSEITKEYVDIIRQSAVEWIGKDAEDILCINCAPIRCTDFLY